VRIRDCFQIIGLQVIGLYGIGRQSCGLQGMALQPFSSKNIGNEYAQVFSGSDMGPKA